MQIFCNVAYVASFIPSFVLVHCILSFLHSVAYPRGGMGGSGPPTFQKVGPRDSHKNVIKLVGGGHSDPGNGINSEK